MRQTDLDYLKQEVEAICTVRGLNPHAAIRMLWPDETPAGSYAAFVKANQPAGACACPAAAVEWEAVCPYCKGYR